MKKYLFALVLAFAILLSGCSRELPPATESPTVTITESTVPETTVATKAPTIPETEPPYDTTELGAHLASVKEESDAMKHYLEFEAMSQGDMNAKSLELYELWDGALNYLWGELKIALPEDEFAVLLDQQRTWITEKEDAMTEVGKEVEGGSLYPLVINSEGAKWTEERVWVLYALLQ